VTDQSAALARLLLKQEIEEFGIAKFVDLCKERVRTFAQRIINQSIRLGQWADWGNDYYTFSDENNYTIWSFLKKCQEKGLIYKGHDVMTWCPRCATGISNMETLSEDYKETTHLSIYARFPLLPFHAALTWEQAINLADMALYTAKNQGRNRAVGIASTTAADREALRDVEADFERAWHEGRVALTHIAGPAAAGVLRAA